MLPCSKASEFRLHSCHRRASAHSKTVQFRLHPQRGSVILNPQRLYSLPGTDTLLVRCFPRAWSREQSLLKECLEIKKDH